MRIILILLLLKFFIVSYSQEYFLKSDGEIVSNIENASVYINCKKQKGKFILKQYYVVNSKRGALNYVEKVEIQGDTTLIIRNYRNNVLMSRVTRKYIQEADSMFHIIDYYYNGIKKQEGYSKSIYPLLKVGQFTCYYLDGKKRSVDSYKNNKFQMNNTWLKDGTKGASNVYLYSDTKPNYHGSISNFRKYIKSNLEYPKNSKNKGIQGTVYIEFVVMETGLMRDIQILSGINDELNNEAIRVVKSATKLWTPGKIESKNVRTRLVIPVNYTL
jgi:TonB family protein